MTSQATSIILSIIVLTALLIPAIRGAVAGFVKTALHLLRFVIAAILAFSFSKLLGTFLKEKWLGAKFYDSIWSALSEKVDFNSATSSMEEAVPSGIRAILSAFDVDVSAIAESAASEGEAMLQSFAQTVSDKIAGIVGVVIAFVAIFVVSLLVLWLVSSLLTTLIERIPLVGGINRVLGFLLGLLLGVGVAWIVSQVLAVFLTTFTEIDYTQIAVLRFFHDISPIRWLLSIISSRIANVTA